VFVSGVQCCGKTPLSFNIWTQTIGTFSKILLFLKSFLSTDLVVCEVLIIKTCCRSFFGGEKPTRLVNYCEHGVGVK